MIKELVVGKKYRVVGEISERHGKYQKSIITFNRYLLNTIPLFDGLVWDDVCKGSYALCDPKDSLQSFSDEYKEWVLSVLEEVEE